VTNRGVQQREYNMGMAGSRHVDPQPELGDPSSTFPPDKQDDTILHSIQDMTESRTTAENAPGKSHPQNEVQREEQECDKPTCWKHDSGVIITEIDRCQLQETKDVDENPQVLILNTEYSPNFDSRDGKQPVVVDRNPDRTSTVFSLIIAEFERHWSSFKEKIESKQFIESISTPSAASAKNAPERSTAITENDGTRITEDEGKSLGIAQGWNGSHKVNLGFRC
jgi:hypothetical protein